MRAVESSWTHETGGVEADRIGRPFVRRRERLVDVGDDNHSGVVCGAGLWAESAGWTGIGVDRAGALRTVVSKGTGCRHNVAALVSRASKS